MPSTTALAADHAWHQMTRVPSILDTMFGVHPMLPAIALDYVQEETGGDRDEAVTELLAAGARALEAAMPDGDLANCRDDAMALMSDLRGECFGHAGAAQGTIYHRASDLCQTRLFYPGTVGPATFSEAEDWIRWSQLAGRALDFARQVVAAAYPADAS